MILTLYVYYRFAYIDNVRNESIILCSGCYKAYENGTYYK